MISTFGRGTESDCIKVSLQISISIQPNCYSIIITRHFALKTLFFHSSSQESTQEHLPNASQPQSTAAGKADYRTKGIRARRPTSKPEEPIASPLAPLVLVGREAAVVVGRLTSEVVAGPASEVKGEPVSVGLGWPSSEVAGGKGLEVLSSPPDPPKGFDWVGAAVGSGSGERL